MNIPNQICDQDCVQHGAHLRRWTQQYDNHSNGSWESNSHDFDHYIMGI